MLTDYSLQKKETGRCPGGSTTGEPRLRGVWGKSWVQNTSYRAWRGWLNCRVTVEICRARP
jgi:hypothetical protein